jgi:hypothetical protein
MNSLSASGGYSGFFFSLFLFSRVFDIAEKLKFQFRGELFNALNHTNLGTPNQFMNTPQFGTITEVSTVGRKIPVSAHLSF